MSCTAPYIGSFLSHSVCRAVSEAVIDVSRAAQIRDIEASFASLEDFDLATLKHPNKRNVTAVESYEVLPDADIWANAVAFRALFSAASPS